MLFQGPIDQMILDKTNAEEPKFLLWTFQGHFRLASACSHGLDIHWQLKPTFGFSFIQKETSLHGPLPHSDGNQC